MGRGFSPALTAPVNNSCPLTCRSCPGWHGHADVMWLIVFLTSLASPIMVTFSLRFLRRGDDDDK